MFDTQTPSNLPVEDIFEKTEPKPAAPPMGASIPPFGLVPRAGERGEGVGGSVQPASSPPPMAPRPPAPAPMAVPPVVPPEPVRMQTPGASWKKVLVVVGILVAVGVIGSAVWLFILKKPPASPQPVPATQAPAPVVPEVISPPPEVAPPTTTAATVDSDNDGLSDAEELQLGTDPRNPDTDGDGLFDGEEEKVYHTNPLDKDTDKDGYSDGEEVQNGYNPLGPGKLFTVPPPATTTP